MPLLINHGIPGAITTLKYMVAIIFPIVIHKHAVLLKSKNFLENSRTIYKTDNSSHDFIIVGAGSAGCVLANRLTASPNNYSVLLIEVGGDPTWMSYFPALAVFMPNNPDIDWMYLSTPQKGSCLACVKQQYKLSRGKSLGGCSNTNFLIYNRGNPKGFDDWANVTADPSWSYENLLGYFKKSENYHGHYPDPEVHGCGGELWVDKSYYAPGLDYYLGAIRDHNLFDRDINQNQTNTFMRMDQTSKRGIRWSTFSAFLKPALGRKHLKVIPYSEVTKLLFHPIITTKVIGVEYVRHTEKDKIRKFAFATKEVIVSAGAYNTPKLLLLSGIGPQEDLENLGINVVKDLPVGKNLQDHPTTMFPIIFNTSGTSTVYERDVVVDTIFQSRRPTRFGFLEGNNLLGTGYMSSPHNDDVNWPDMATFISYLGVSHIISDIFAPLLNLPVKDFDNYLDPLNGRDGNIVLVTQMKPRSVGYVTLNGTDPFNHPIIVPNFFTDKDGLDIKGMIFGMRYMVNFYESSQTYQKIKAHLSYTPWPTCADLPFKSDDYFECHIRQFTFSLWHPCCTTKMGRADDPTAVVDSRLRVFGIEGLRVIDTSIMPSITNGNTNAPAIAIGEKGADMVIEDWGGITRPPQSHKSCI